jgi:hypothetical protein
MNDITCEMIGLKDFHPVWQVYYEDILMTIDDPAMRNRIRAAACKRYYPLFAQEAKGCSIISLLTAILLITLLVVVCCILAEKDYSRVAKEKEERDRWPWRMTIAT